MSVPNDQIRELIVQTLRHVYTDALVLEVPQGVAIVRTNGRHTLIRVDDALFEVVR